MPRLFMSKKQSRKLNRWKILWIVVISLVLAVLVVTAFGIIFLKRAVIDYRTEHDFSTRDPAFFGSAHAMADSPPLEGNAVQLPTMANRFSRNARGHPRRGGQHQLEAFSLFR